MEKFTVSYQNSFESKKVILFQHAVHERIRLEELIEGILFYIVTYQKNKKK